MADGLPMQDAIKPGQDLLPHRLPEPEQGQAAEELLPEAGAFWNRRLTLTLLRREAEALLEAVPTAAPGETKAR